VCSVVATLSDLPHQIKKCDFVKVMKKCGMYGHLKRNCPGEALFEKDSEASASNISLVLGDDGHLI
jgi:hypothetical protein